MFTQLVPQEFYHNVEQYTIFVQGQNLEIKLKYVLLFLVQWCIIRVRKCCVLK